MQFSSCKCFGLGSWVGVQVFGQFDNSGWKMFKEVKCKTAQAKAEFHRIKNVLCNLSLPTDGRKST